MTVATVTASSVASYLRHREPTRRRVAVSNVMRLAGGMSRETWTFDATWDAGSGMVGNGFIIRRDPPASILETDRSVEFEVLRALADTPVPVPRVHWAESDPQWLGAPFFVMDRLPGQAAPEPLLEHAFDDVRPRLAARMVEILSDMHAMDPEVLGLGSLGRPPHARECARHEIGRWEAILDRVELNPNPAVRGAIAWLRNHLPPPPERVTLVHGDYRAGNFLYDELGTIHGILDWELAHLGDPMEDVAWVCTFRLGAHGSLGGLFGREEYFALYERLTGHRIDRDALRFWEVMGYVKIATILETGRRSFCDGLSNDLDLALAAVLGRGVGAKLLAGLLERR